MTTPQAIGTVGPAPTLLQADGQRLATVLIPAPPAGTVNVENQSVALGAAGTFNFVGAGVTTGLSGPGGTATVNIPGGGGSSTGVQVTGLNTTAMPGTGLFAYASSANVVQPTDAAAIESASPLGAYEGTAGQVQAAGAIVDAAFTTIGGAPVVGAPVWLAVAASEAGAAGKLTATPPATPNVLTQVGTCLDNTTYGGSKTSRVLLQIQTAIQL